jgi:hypothetical protein
MAFSAPRLRIPTDDEVMVDVGADDFEAAAEHDKQAADNKEQHEMADAEAIVVEDETEAPQQAFAEVAAHAEEAAEGGGADGDGAADREGGVVSGEDEDFWEGFEDEGEAVHDLSQLTSAFNHSSLAAYLKSHYPLLADLLPKDTKVIDLFEQVEKKKDISIFFDASDDREVLRELARFVITIEKQLELEAKMGKLKARREKQAERKAKRQRKWKQPEEPPEPPTMSLEDAAAAKLLAEAEKRPRDAARSCSWTATPSLRPAPRRRRLARCVPLCAPPPSPRPRPRLP